LDDLHHTEGEHAERRGARILGEPMEILTGWAVEFTDPWGNVLGLTDYLKDPSRGRKTS